MKEALPECEVIDKGEYSSQPVLPTVSGIEARRDGSMALLQASKRQGTLIANHENC
jgi:hypothetical protein